MRWQNLFDDLESQLEGEADAEHLEVLAEEERLRLARLGIRDRVAALRDRDAQSEVAIVTASGERLRLALSACGRDWIAGERDSGSARSVVVPISGIAAMDLEPRLVPASLAGSSGAESPVALSARLGVAVVLRDLARRRCPVEVLVAGERRFGRVERVGRDHVDLAEHPAGEPWGEVRRVAVLALAAVEFVAF